MASGTERVDTAQLRQVAGRFETEVGSDIDQARTAFKGAIDIEYSNFTSVSWALPVVYVEAANFAERDMETKRQNARTFHDNLIKTANHWDAAEQASTITTGDGR